MRKMLFLVTVVAAVFFFASSFMAVNKAAAETPEPQVEQPLTVPEMSGEQPPAEATPGLEISPKGMEEPLMTEPAQTPAKKKKTSKRKPAQKRAFD